MSDTAALLNVLRQTVPIDAASAVEALIGTGADCELVRINPLEFAKQSGVPEECAIDTFLHAAHLGLFEMSWNVICPGCGGILDASSTLKNIHAAQYNCNLCDRDYETTLDQMVEVTFTVNPRVRRIVGHDPNTLPLADYFTQIFFGSGMDVPKDLDQILDSFTLDTLEISAGQKAQASLQLPAEFIIVFDPVTHTTQFIDVKGEPTKERQTLGMVFNKVRSLTETVEMRPGPLRLSFENRTDVRVLPSIWVAGHELHELLGRHRDFLTAKRLLTNQTFRDIYGTDTLEVDQRLKITSLTFLFTDLKGSTELYERVGDMVAYDLVRQHFAALNEIVAAESGAVVKTIGDAVMATFPTPDRAVAAALRMRDAMHNINAQRGSEDLILKIGVHEGPCLAVVLNDRQDYFGQTVNIAARVQSLADSRSIFASVPVVTHPGTADLLAQSGLVPRIQRRAVRGIADELEVYEIP